MTITSYAQNFEDVILWRALKHVERGFYIDVGAQDPVIESMSLAFYEQGWRGVHIEANPQYAEKLRGARPDEEVVETAVGKTAGEILFFEVPNTGLSTGDEEIAKRHEAKGHFVKRTTVPCRPFSSILDVYKDRDIHWLKIDVEGMEDDVIDGWPPSQVRPWIVVIESTFPNSPEPNHFAWEPKLLKLGYDFVYFDGLNRFFVSHGRPELKASFGSGPNLFDDFQLTRQSFFFKYAQAALEAEQQQLAFEQELQTRERNARIAVEQRLRVIEAEKNSAVQQLAAERQARVAAEEQFTAVVTSISWQITTPLRSVSRVLQWLSQGARTWLSLKPGSRPRRTARYFLGALARFIQRRQWLSLPLKAMLYRFPALERRLRQLLATPSSFYSPPLGSPDGTAPLPPPARRIYAELKDAIARQQRKA